MTAALCTLLVSTSLLVSKAALTLSPAPTLQDEAAGPKPEDILIGGDANQRYLLHAPEKDVKEPAAGWRLLVVMPGGDGSAEFAPFVGRIRENALGKDWLIAQIVAPKWDDKQGETNVWPTEKNSYPKMKFPTEKLFDAVLDDLGKKRKLDPKFVYTLSWSSSGMAAYTLALEPKSRVTGSFVAMSVYRPDELPPRKNAAGRNFYILHSPQDQICPLKLAEQARDELKKNGANVEFTTYEGGHGWHGDVFAVIKKGIDWLAESKGKPSKDKPAKGKPTK
jgi:predicted peptidase